MKTKIWALVMVLGLGLASLHADAASRFGSGKSVGQQSGNVTQREAVKPAGAAAAPVATPATAAPAAAAGAMAPKRPWGAMLGGVAAGLGLAWLAHSMGLGEGFGQFLMIGLLVMLAMMAYGMFKRSRKSSAGGASPYALQGAGGPVLAPSYSPHNVGNDASARPWERNSMFEAEKPGATRFQSSQDAGGMSGTGSGAQTWGVPAEFDTPGFLEAAKRNFVGLQQAWDRSDVASLRAMMTDTMLAEIQTQLAERETHTGANPNTTDVVMLDAQLLGIEDLGEHYLASVEFSGMIREEPSAGPSAFREVWNMTKPKAGGGWLVAGVQALQ